MGEGERFLTGSDSATAPLSLCEGRGAGGEGFSGEGVTSQTGPTPAQKASFLGGALTLFVALGPPLDDWADHYLLSAHMVQHLLLIMLAAPLLLYGTPGWMLAPLTRNRVTNTIGYWLTRRHRVMGRLVRPFVDATLTNTPVGKQALVADEGHRPDRVVVLENGVDTARFNRFMLPDTSNVRMRMPSDRGSERVTCGRASAMRRIVSATTNRTGGSHRASRRREPLSDVARPIAPRAAARSWRRRSIAR